MLEKIAVLGGDLRQTYLVRQLLRSGFDTANFAVPQLTDSHPTLQNALHDAAAVALPMPALTSEGDIRAEARAISLHAVLDALPRDAIVFGGMLSRVREACSRRNLRVIDYAADNAVAAANAVPTAEGAIFLAMERLPITLSQSQCLVIGFGRIGKILAARLRGLNADVTVAARKAEDRVLAESLGFAADRTGRYLRGLRQYDCVFNTVPAPVLQKAHLDALAASCPIIDLATGGGLSPELDAAAYPNYRLAPALPSRAAPATAAEALHRCILETFSAV